MMFSSPKFVTCLQCIVCGEKYPHGNIFTCAKCGAEGILDVQYNYDAIRNEIAANGFGPSMNMWRYRPLLPVSPDLPAPHLQVGWTPVYDVLRLSHILGLRKLYIKDDGRNPTNSFTDRASSVGVLKAMEFGFRSIACGSTGNAGPSLAGLSAATGLRSFIFVPQRTPEPNVTQLLIFGATVFKVQGTYGQAFDLCREACTEFGWYDRNSGTNPYLVEGKKTAGLEIAEQCRNRLPNWVAVSVGGGCTIGGIGKGLQEMKKLGIIDHMPRLLGVQAEGARPIVDAFASGSDLVPTDEANPADSIAVGAPRNWRRAIKQIQQSHGDMVAVGDEEILEAMRITARLAGVFGETAGVAALAGVRKALDQKIISANETVLVVITGNGLKDIQSAKKAAGCEHSIEPTLDAVAAVLKQR